ncbi:hypothetical protein ACQP3D_29775, partial [Escherichia coli]
MTSFIPCDINYGSLSVAVLTVWKNWCQAHMNRNGSCVTSLLEAELELCLSTVTLGKLLLRDLVHSP